MAFLGIDVGTSGTKTLLLSDKGKVLATAESPHAMLTPKPGWSEQHPEEWYRAAAKATRAVMKKARLKPADVRAVGFSGQMHGSVFLDARGKVLRPALLWNDQRTAAQCAEIESKAGGRAALLEMVSNPALTGFTAPKILWLQQNEPAKYEKCRQILLPKDYLRFRMTGEFATEVSDASGTLLLDVKARAWHDRLIGILEIDRALLPRVVESHEVTGALSAAAAKDFGIAPGIPVVGGAGDQAAGAVGTGVVQPGLVSASMGTSGVIFAASPGPQTDPEGRVHTMCHAVPNTWCVFGCMLSAGGSFQHLRHTLFPDQLRKLKDPGELYPAMIREAQSAPAGSEGLFYLPYLTGERCPHPDPKARAAFIGLTPRHGRAHLLRATLEGITFGMREQIDIFRQMGIPISQVRANGGGARSEFWRQLQADMYDAPVVTISVAEGAALGAAILAAVGAGAYRSVQEICREIIQIRHTSRPNKKSAAFYAEQYSRYAELYPALRGWFR
jgi:xylulokinase